MNLDTMRPSPDINKFLRGQRKRFPFTVTGSFYLIEPDGKSELVWEKKQDALVVASNELLLALFQGASFTVTVKDTGGTNRGVATSNNMRVNAGVGIVTYGIVLGTGSGAFAPNQNSLGTNNNTLIGQGSNPNQLLYGAMTNTVPTASGAEYYYNVQRTFTNSSGGDITANEMALYCYDGSYYLCFARDLTGGVLIANGKVGTGVYTFTTTI